MNHIRREIADADQLCRILLDIETSDVLTIRISEFLYYDLKDTRSITPSLARHVCREIGIRIVAGHWQEGSLIEDESSLARRFGVSRSVVRESVRLLTGKGVLSVMRGSGTRVKRRSSWALLDDDVLAWHLSVEPKPAFLWQLMEIRRMMEPKAAAWAAAFGTDEQHQTIADAQAEMEQHALSVENFVIADAKFHRAVLRAANNEILRSMEGVIFSALLSSIRLTNAEPEENRSSLPVHREVLDAILARDADTAERKMLLHLEETSSRLTLALPGIAPHVP